MLNDNVLVTEKNGSIAYMGSGLNRYVNTDIAAALAYPEGKPEKSDVAVWISNDVKKIRRMYDCLTCGGDNASCEASVREICMVASLYNRDIMPVMKKNYSSSTGEGCSAGKGYIIDTIYERRDISVCFSRETGNNRIEIKADGRTVEFEAEGIYEMLVIINENGIKYFTPPDSKKDSYYILSQQCYDGYADREKIIGRGIREIFSQEIADALLSFEVDNSETEEQNYEPEYRKTVFIRSSCLCIKKDCIDISGVTYNTFVIENASEALAKLVDYNMIYKTLDENNNSMGAGTMHINSFRIWGSAGKLRKIEEMLQKVSPTKTTVLLTGESGTGKTFLAREIHNSSSRNSKPFVHVNCAAIPYQLMESELFGYEEGAFTGAKKGGKAGLFEMAYGGTLFLDEITEIPLSLQGKLLEVLQNKTYFRVGGTKKLIADVRLIAATNKNLKEAVKERNFREDLYYRINVFPIELPPLRDRIDSIHSIIADIFPEICERLEVEPVVVSYAAMEKIRSYYWPGNIRELENVLEKAVILCDHKIILEDDIVLPENEEFILKPKTLRELKENCEKEAIRNALRMFHGDKMKAARYLDIGRTGIFEKTKKYGLDGEGDEGCDFR